MARWEMGHGSGVVRRAIPGRSGTQDSGLSTQDSRIPTHTSHTFVPVQTAAYRVNGFFGVSWIARGTIPAGTARRYRLSTDVRKAVEPPPGGGVHAFHDGKPIRQDGDEDAQPSTMTLKVGDRPVLTYQAAEAVPPVRTRVEPPES